MGEERAGQPVVIRVHSGEIGHLLPCRSCGWVRPAVCGHRVGGLIHSARTLSSDSAPGEPNEEWDGGTRHPSRELLVVSTEMCAQTGESESFHLPTASAASELARHPGHWVFNHSCMSIGPTRLLIQPICQVSARPSTSAIRRPRRSVILMNRTKPIGTMRSRFASIAGICHDSFPT